MVALLVGVFIFTKRIVMKNNLYRIMRSKWNCSNFLSIRHIVNNSYLMLVIVAIIVYLPIFSNVFTLKFDIQNHFFPIRHHMGLFIQNGQFPFWDPYFELGYPIHSDMQNGVWNPLVILIAFFTGYSDITHLHIEIFSYILISGFGFYTCCKIWGFSNQLKLFLSISYMGGGFMTCDITHLTWIAGFAYFPFMFYFFYQLFHRQSILNATKFIFTTVLFFLSSYPGQIIISFYFFLSYLVYLLYTNWEDLRVNRLAVYFISSLVFILLICSPAIFSYVEFFEYYKRGSAQSFNTCNYNTMDFKSLSTLIFPFCISNRFNLDITHQSIYIGVVPLYLGMFSFKFKILKQELFFVSIFVISFLASFGKYGGIRYLLFKYVPYMDTFQNPVLFKFLCIFLVTILIGISIKNNFNSNTNVNKIFTSIIILY